MRKYNAVFVVITSLITVTIAGCVERQLTINTEPQGAVVTLNDEEIGISPVTVAFNWYGDYRVRITREGYEPLNTHRELKGPWYDKFPFDFFAQILNPKRIVDRYEWTFALTEKKQISKEELLENARKLKSELQ